MGRRYLLREEAEASLRRHRSVECFLGDCAREGRPGIRHLSLILENGAIVMRLYETADLGRPDFLDISEFGPLDPDLADGDADEVEKFVTFDDCLQTMRQRWPGSDRRLVNEGIVQDEYADYIASR